MQANPPLTTVSVALPARGRTPPDLKWLLNERAALAGSVETAVRRSAALEARFFAKERALAVIRKDLEASNRTIEKLKARVRSLDIAMARAYPEVAPDVAGLVLVRGRLGKQGALTAFVTRTLQQVAPQRLTAPVLLAMLQQHLGIRFECSDDRQRVKDTVESCLRRLRDKNGTVESSPDPRNPGWCWKSAPTLDELRALSQSASRGVPDERGSDEDAGGREVTGQ